LLPFCKFCSIHVWLFVNESLHLRVVFFDSVTKFVSVFSLALSNNVLTFLSIASTLTPSFSFLFFAWVAPRLSTSTQTPAATEWIDPDPTFLHFLFVRTFWVCCGKGNAEGGGHGWWWWWCSWTKQQNSFTSSKSLSLSIVISLKLFSHLPFVVKNFQNPSPPTTPPKRYYYYKCNTCDGWCSM